MHQPRGSGRLSRLLSEPCTVLIVRNVEIWPWLFFALDKCLMLPRHVWFVARTGKVVDIDICRCLWISTRMKSDVFLRRWSSKHSNYHFGYRMVNKTIWKRTGSLILPPSYLYMYIRYKPIFQIASKKIFRSIIPNPNPTPPTPSIPINHPLTLLWLEKIVDRESRKLNNITISLTILNDRSSAFLPFYKFSSDFDKNFFMRFPRSHVWESLGRQS